MNDEIKKTEEELESLIHKEPVLVVRNTIIKAVTATIAVVSFSILLLSIQRRDSVTYNLLLLMITVSLLSSLYASLFQKKYADTISCIVSFLTVLAMTQLTPSHFSDFITLSYGIAIFLTSNYFGKHGLYFGSVYILAIVLYYYLLYPGGRFPHQIISTALNAITLGSIPVLLQKTYDTMQKAKIEEHRAEIAATRNQELVAQYQNNLITHESPQQFPHQDFSHYTSPYEQD